MKAIIIYQDFASGAWANAALRRWAQSPDVNVEWQISPWRVDMLKFPPTAAEAMADAVDAHLILFACRQAQPLPFWLQHWLDQWADHRQITEAAITVLGHGNAGMLPATALSDLWKFALGHGLNLIVEEPVEPASHPQLVIGTKPQPFLFEPLAFRQKTKMAA